MRSAAVAYVERADGRLLVVWNRRYRTWTMPGGMIEEGETPEAAVSRELAEETGLEAKATTFLCAGGAPSSLHPDRASEVIVFAVVALGDPEEREPGCPVTWMTREDFRASSAFADWYERHLFSRVRVGELGPAFVGADPKGCLVRGVELDPTKREGETEGKIVVLPEDRVRRWFLYKAPLEGDPAPGCVHEPGLRTLLALDLELGDRRRVRAVVCAHDALEIVAAMLRGAVLLPDTQREQERMLAYYRSLVIPPETPEGPPS